MGDLSSFVVNFHCISLDQAPSTRDAYSETTMETGSTAGALLAWLLREKQRMENKEIDKSSLKCLNKQTKLF